MATMLTTCFVRWSFTGLNSKPSNVLAFPSPFRRPLPATCRIRKRNAITSSQLKNQSIKKVPDDQPSADGNLYPNEDDDSNKKNSVSIDTDAEQAIAENSSSPAEITPLTINKDGAELGEQPSGDKLQNLWEMMRYAEKISDVHLLEARVRALEELRNILHEKEAMLAAIEVLEKRLAETEAKLKTATQENAYVEVLAKEYAFLEAALKDLESDSVVYQENLSEMLSKLRVESKDLKDKVESLQLLLDKATKQANKPIIVLQQNQDLQRKVKKLRAPDEERVENMPGEFWSRLLLVIDGWSLEKKISIEEAKLLREKVWKRSRGIRDTYIAVIGKSEHEAISAVLALLPRSTGLYVIHIASEMAPAAKVGGLADVVSGLGKALQNRGHLVEIILPKYDCMQHDHIRDLRVLDAEIESYFEGQQHKNKIWVGTVEGLPVYFIEPRHHGNFFGRGKFYGEYDDFKRFSFFSRAALDFLYQSGKRPDIIHCHDWTTAFVPPLYWDIYAPKGLNSARICFTCHNFEYQGIAQASELASCGLDVHRLNKPDRLRDNKALDRINLVKGGIVFSNIVTTVSPTYAERMQTEEEGQGLHTTLTLHSNKFIGILNGIDTDAWNPETDTILKVQYNANDLQGKSENKKALRRKMGLSSADERMPLVGCVTRLVPHKGVFLIRHALYRTLELGGQFVLLGSSPIPEIQKEFEDIAFHFRNHGHIRLILKYDESLSHAIYAASDMLIIPSIFEPCGLTQMISMRYGTIPIVRKTGGLNDSVFDVDDDTVPSELRNGFTFLDADEQGIEGALSRAFYLYKNHPESWNQLVQKDMNIDVSWKSSAAKYEAFYYRSLPRVSGRNTFI